MTQTKVDGSQIANNSISSNKLTGFTNTLIPFGNSSTFLQTNPSFSYINGLLTSPYFITNLLNIDQSSLTNKFVVNQDVNGVGTVSISSGTNTVTGSSTLFTDTFSIGDLITIAGVTKTITSITDDSNLTVNSNWSSTLTGQTYSLTSGQRFIVKGNGNIETNSKESFYVKGGIKYSVKNISTTYQVLKNDSVILADSTSAGFTITLPLISDNLNQRIDIKDIGFKTKTNNITIVPSGSNKIENNKTSLVMSVNGVSFSLINNGNNNWYVI